MRLRAAAPLLLATSTWAAGCPGSDADTDVDPICEDAPVTTWANFGEGFLLQACQPCHASSTAERNGAPETVVFDTEADAALFAGSILAAATGEDPSMPPEGGVSDDNRYFLEAWLTCWPPSR